MSPDSAGGSVYVDLIWRPYEVGGGEGIETERRLQWILRVHCASIARESPLRFYGCVLL